MRITAISILSSLILLASCAEDEIINQPLTTGEIKIDSTVWVESTGKDKTVAYLSGRVLKSGGLEVERGAILDTVGGVAVSGKFQEPDSILKYALVKESDLNGGVGKFTIAATTPKVRTKYLYRFYVKNFKGTVLSPVDSFVSAPNLPATSDIFLALPSKDSVFLGAFLTENGGEQLISKGFVVSKLGGATLQNGIVGLSSTDSTKTFFKASVKGLEPNTNYKARAFAQNRGGVKYSKDYPFKTAP